MHPESGGITVELNAKVLLKRAEIVSSKSRVKMVFKLGNERNTAAGDKNVINIDKLGSM